LIELNDLLLSATDNSVTVTVNLNHTASSYKASVAAKCNRLSPHLQRQKDYDRFIFM